MVDVFISYSRKDHAMVSRLARAIADEGYAIWWDEELPPHKSYGDVITEKIASAKAAIVVWSADSAQSEWVRAEADMARNQRKLIQTALDSVVPPLPFNQIQYADLSGWQGEADHPGWRKVKVSLADLCGPRDGSAPIAPPPSPPPQPAAPLAQPEPAPRPGANWPMIAAFGVAALAVAAAAVMYVGKGEEAAPKPENPPVAAPAAPASEPVEQAQAPSDSPEYDLLATVSDPDGYSNVRGAPSLEGKIVGRVKVGEAFSTFEQTGKWWKVRLADGTRGYIARSRIRLPGEEDGTTPIPAPSTPVAAEPEPANEPASEPQAGTDEQAAARPLTERQLRARAAIRRWREAQRN